MSDFDFDLSQYDEEYAAAPVESHSESVPDGKYQAVMGYKEEAGSGKAAFKVDRYYRTEWLTEKELPLHLEGLTIDAVYENFIRQIAGDRLTSNENTTLKESVEQQKQREQIEKQIAALETKMKKEKQLNRKMELKAEIKRLKNEVVVIK